MFLFPRRKYRHLNKVLVSRSALQQNFQALQAAHPEAKVCPVIKSNAYGHGLQTVAPIFDSFGYPFLIVDSLYEAYELSKLQVQTPILILGYTFPENFQAKRVPYHFAVYDLEVAQALNKYQPGCKVHVFIDTGMRREGIQLTELPVFLDQLLLLKNIEIEGVTSHFSDADNSKDMEFTRKQVTVFKMALKEFEKRGITPKWRHISASGATFKVQDKTFNLLRVGLASYGIHPLEEKDVAYDTLSLQPAMRFVSTVVQIKEISPGDEVGYSRSFTAKKKMIIGILPAGYYEGVDRRLSNLGVIKVRGVYCPILGRVSMNMTTIDLTHIPDAEVGDEAEVFSNNPDDENFVKKQAVAGSISYELFVHIAESVRREVVE